MSFIRLTSLRGKSLPQLSSSVGSATAFVSRTSRTILPRPLLSQRRLYHDDDVYGYRVRKPFTMPDYSMEELNNRVDNANLLRLVMAYRTNGHRGAHLDPLDIMQREVALSLDVSRYGFTDSKKKYNLKGIFHVNGPNPNTNVGLEEADIETILSHLKDAYCGRIAYEFMHIPDANERRWWYKVAESLEKPPLSIEEKKRIYELMTRSETFDHFMAKKFAQVKRYGLEGAESMMPALDRLFEISSKAGLKNIVLCMPHRGRLNLLTDLLQYNSTALFHKVKGNSEFPDGVVGMGDVLSHIAHSPKLDYGGKEKLQVELLQNPSHLESVNPVAMGKARAKQMDMMATEKNCDLGDRVMCVQLHGDAAFTGQGVVMESFGISNLPHYSSGGSIHLVVNNQIGYTTPAQNARSSFYSSDIGKMVNTPVLHVNGQFPEDVVRAVELAFEYRNKFRKDVIIDLITYRRWGHNELDEPAFTQPLMYNNIRSRKSVPKMYEEKLLAEGVLSSEADVEKLRDAYYNKLEKDLNNVETYKPVADHLKGIWAGMIQPTMYDKDAISNCDTGVSADILKHVGVTSATPAPDTKIHPRIDKHHLQPRLARIAEGKKIDWATAEALAWGALLMEGYNVRISGQDVGRGTFSQRHVMLVDQETERVSVPLNQLDGGRLEVANSNLSEFAVLGFEYGMSWENPRLLSIWEAQFGDFFNSAQVVIDTYISSGETKWLRQSSLVMLLPHGYDGAGPEHSSSRIERFLQLCDDRFDVLNDSIPVNPNMHVVNCTTPAQYFHVLRRQMKRNFRKPLIVISPKVLLKFSGAVSDLADMEPGTSFQPVLKDTTIQDKAKVERVIFVSGKLYYDLLKERSSRGVANNVALVRIEELCPFPRDAIWSEIKAYSNAKDFIWCQEEPQNNGAYSYMAPRISQLLPSSHTLKYVGRVPAASPATGISSRHKIEQAEIIRNGFEA